jgi:predicted GNAT family N-acyltransferase
MISVKVVETQDELKKIFAIREEVFVKEQEVSPEDEYDEFEEISTHFIAIDEKGTPCGTARWRFTDHGMKLERFAVLKSHRGKAIGQALVKAVIEDVRQHPDAKGKKMYLHAQIPAVSLYARFGLEKVGEQFEECNIMHYQMEKML